MNHGLRLPRLAVDFWDTTTPRSQNQKTNERGGTTCFVLDLVRYDGTSSNRCDPQWYGIIPDMKLSIAIQRETPAHRDSYADTTHYVVYPSVTHRGSG